MFPRFNRRAREFAEKHNIAGTVGSDAHAAFEVGRSLLLLDQFTDAEGLRKVIRGAKMQVKWSPWWFHFISRYASIKKKIQS
jgi:predicted metal-dependent phosphoesterase TrpH